MSDFRIYWKNFAADRDAFGFGAASPLSDWRTSATRFYESVENGDWLWFFTNGQACNMPESTAGYLVNLFRVQSKEPNQGDDQLYVPEKFRYTIFADKECCFWFDPPVFVDVFIRPGGHPADWHIGKLIQGPQPLKEETVAELEKALQREQSNVFARINSIRKGVNAR
jgi:hypothetical protein